VGGEGEGQIWNAWLEPSQRLFLHQHPPHTHTRVYLHAPNNPPCWRKAGNTRRWRTRFALLCATTKNATLHFHRLSFNVGSSQSTTLTSASLRFLRPWSVQLSYSDMMKIPTFRASTRGLSSSLRWKKHSLNGSYQTKNASQSLGMSSRRNPQRSSITCILAMNYLSSQMVGWKHSSFAMELSLSAVLVRMDR